MDALDFQIRIFDYGVAVPFRGSFPRLLQRLDMEDCDSETAASLAKHLRDKRFIDDLRNNLSVAVWQGADNNWRLVDLTYQRIRDMPKGFCALCGMDEDDEIELVSAGGKQWAHPVCLPTLLKRREEVTNDE